jgi:hypothetical protein
MLEAFALEVTERAEYTRLRSEVTVSVLNKTLLNHRLLISSVLNNLTNS